MFKSTTIDFDILYMQKNKKLIYQKSNKQRNKVQAKK